MTWIVVVFLILCIFNVVMWSIFAAKFKKTFSTDEILERTRQSLNTMLIDINRNAERNISLIDERIKALKSVSAEADRHVLLLKSEVEKTQKALEAQLKLEQLSNELKESQSGSVKAKGKKSASKKSIVEENLELTMNGSLNNNETEENKKLEKNAPEENQSPDLFLDFGQPYTKGASITQRYEKNMSKQNSGTSNEIKKDGHKTNSSEVEFVNAPQMIVPKKEFNIVVREMYERGESIENIASTLGRSTQEVKFSLEFS